MKILSIGDTHGHFIVEEIKPLLSEYDKIVFVGDYVDSFELTNLTINTNLFDLIQLKKDNLDKIVLLWGNHDLHYLFSNMIHRCSGYRSEVKFDLFDIFNENRDLFQAAYQIDNYLWTHAGVHLGWYRYRFTRFIKDNNLITPLGDGLNIAAEICYAFDKYEKCLFDVGYMRGGDKDVGGPFWCDRTELISSPLREYHQIVGHTKVDEYKTIYKHNNTSITFIDTIERQFDKYGHIKKNLLYSLKI